MVEVFKTNVEEKSQSTELLGILSDAFPLNKIGMDLSDCDKVLRVEGANIDSPGIIKLVKHHGFLCEPLD